MKKPSCPGFTLVELLVAITLLALLVVLLAAISGRVSSVWLLTESQVERRQTARVIADFIAADLRGALLPVNATEQEGFQFVVNPTGLDEKYKNRDAAFWQAPIAPDTRLGDAAVVGYFVRWDGDDGRPTARLCRVFIQPVNGTAADGTPSPNPDYKIITDPAAWINDEIIDRIAPGDAANNFMGLVGEHVLAVWFKCMNATGVDLPDADSRLLGNLPAAVEVSFVQIDSPSARRMTPALQSTIQSLAATSADAPAFVESARQNPVFAPVLGSLRAYSSTIRLENVR